jgi:hypothetical protein
MTTNQRNQNSKTPMSLTRCRSWTKTIRNYGQSCGDVTSRNCPRCCGYRRHRNLHGVRRFLRPHASADYVPPVAAFEVAEFLAALCTAAHLDIYLDISCLDSTYCGRNSRCCMGWFAAGHRWFAVVQP